MGCCFKCNTFGHRANTCTNPGVYFLKTKCNYCQELGHLKKNCPLFEASRECGFCHQIGQIKIDCVQLRKKIERTKIREAGLVPFITISSFIEKKSEPINSENIQVQLKENENESELRDDTIIASNNESSIVATINLLCVVAQIDNDHLFPSLSHMSTPSKASAIPPGTELNTTPIFDAAKLINKYSTMTVKTALDKREANNYPKLNCIIEKASTQTSKRCHDVILSPVRSESSSNK